MNIALFIPCYVNQFYPQVAIATLELLEKQGLNVTYPIDQTCCGQPLANSGFEKMAAATYTHFVETFSPFDYIVAPSGSCVYHVRKHFDFLEQTDEVKHVRTRTYELGDFLLHVLGRQDFDAEFPYRVALHQSCHGLRGLRLGKSSEIVDESYSTTSQLLNNVKGIELVKPGRADECCGFGGTFAVIEAAVSVKMGVDRIQDFIDNKAEVITATDMSCLMHLEGIIRRRNLPVKVKHIAEILNNSRQGK